MSTAAKKLSTEIPKDQQIIYIPELARILGITEEAVRCRYKSYKAKGKNGRSPDLPPPMRFGDRVCWSRRVVDLWIEKKSAPAIKLLSK